MMSKKSSAFSVAKPSDSPGLLLWQTTNLWQRAIRNALKPYKISHTEFVILANICWFSEQAETVTQVLISETSKLDKMVISNTLKKLVQKGLVERKEHKEDTRAKSVTLTKEGFSITKQLVKIVESADAAFFSPLNRPQQKTLNSIFLELIKNR